MTGVVSRLRHSFWTLPLAAIAAVVVFGLNENAYHGANAALQGLSARAEARDQIQTLLRRLIDAETGQRGYLLTGRKEYLDPYALALKDVDGLLRLLQTYFADDAAAQAVLSEIGNRSREKLSEVATSIQLYDDGGRHDAWRELLLTNIGREKMVSIRELTTQLLAMESKRVEGDRQALFTTLQLSRLGVDAMVGISLLALFLFLRQTRNFDTMQRKLASALQAERDKLEADVVRRTADLTELAGHLQTAREDERSRLARELHDELGALLTAAKLDAARLKRSLGPMSPESEARLKHLNETINDGIGLKRRIIEDLRPSSLSNLGLVAALEIQTREYAKRSEIRVSTDLESVPMSDGAEITVFRLVQESLTNIAKYAGATEVTVTMAREGERVYVAVRDNGKGFDAQSRRGTAHGLMGMRYRVETEGGMMQVDSAPGRGTVVQAWLPALSPQAQAVVEESP